MIQGWLSRLRWPGSELPLRVLAREVDAVSQEDHLSYPPGSLTSYDLHGIHAGRPSIVCGYDVCCPGCGQKVYALDPELYPVSKGLSCPVEITFVPCCGRTFKLISGEWVERRR